MSDIYRVVIVSPKEPDFTVEMFQEEGDAVDYAQGYAEGRETLPNGEAILECRKVGKQCWMLRRDGKSPAYVRVRHDFDDRGDR